jgi:Putative polyhydroxyalkanoic acid system protein (PHA_gran_rgn)
MTGPLSIAIPHRLGKDEAKRRIDAGFLRLQPEIARFVATLDGCWDADRMTITAQALGQTVTGRIDVLDAVVNVEIDLPGALGLLGRTIAGQVRSRGTAMLDRPPGEHG